MWHHDHRRRPPWWPSNEPWPPPTRARRWRRGRSRFVRRLAVVVTALLLLSAVGAVTLIGMLFGERGSDAAVSLAPLIVAAAVGLVALALLSTVVRGVGGPLGDLVEAANRVAEGDYSTRVEERGPPSLRVVGTAFNTMASRLEVQDRQRRDLMADVAHELRTPLSVIQGRLEGLLDGVYPRDDETLTGLSEETRTLARLVEDLRTLAHAESGMLTLQKEPTDVALLAQDAVNSCSGQAERRHVSVTLDAPADLPLILIDPLRVREVLVNLLSNALHHTPSGGRISVVITALNTRVVVTVEDTGSGIPADDLAKIFDRFYKGATSRGSGLGLTISRSLVAAHGGEIHAESRPHRGTTMTFTLPSG